MIVTDIIEVLRYNLICFGIPPEGPAEVFCDNKSVSKNSNIPTSALNKRHSAIFYHRVRKYQVAGILWVGWILGEFNLSYLFTKTTMLGNASHNLVEPIFLNMTAPIGDIEKV